MSCGHQVQTLKEAQETYFTHAQDNFSTILSPEMKECPQYLANTNPLTTLCGLLEIENFGPSKSGVHNLQPHAAVH